MNGSLTGTTAVGQSRPWINGNEKVIQTPKNWSLITKCSLVSDTGHPNLSKVLLH